MKVSKIDLIYSSFLFIVSCIFVFDLFFSPGRPASFDANFHITNIAQYYSALKSGDFPVVWTDGFANYGLPIAIVSHQLTNYLGGILTFITHNPTVSFNIVIFIGVVLGNLFYYGFLRIYVKPHIAFLATVFFNFTAYRIINLYVRGAAPELFSNIFPPLIFIATYFLVKKKRISAFFLLSLSFFLLALNHPMMLVIYSFLFFPYFLFVTFVEDGKVSFTKNIVKKIKISGFFFGALFLGVGMAAYYLLPLLVEIKYFYYGLEKNHYAPNNFLSLASFFNPTWYYFTKADIFTRGHVVITGLLESLVILIGIGIISWKLLKKKMKGNITLLEFSVATSLVIIFFTTSASNVFYQYITVLSNIQFPWRMLSAFIFLPPIILAIILRNTHRYIIFPFLILIFLIAFPQLYGKNYTIYPQEMYFFNPINVHSILMNTIWSGQSEDYPVRRDKIAISKGVGSIESKKIKNSSREYVINAKTDLQVVDYTFYFPGWGVFLDGQKRDIQFQDPEYRGVITYLVPAGTHTVLVKFEDTKIRLAGKILSVVFFSCFLGLFIVRKQFGKRLVH